MKCLLVIIVLSFLTSCATTEPYNNEQIRTQCPIGYHEEYSRSIKITKKNGETRTEDEFKCVADK